MNRKDYEQIKFRNEQNGGDTENSVASHLFDTRGLKPPAPGESVMDANPQIKAMRDEFHREIK